MGNAVGKEKNWDMIKKDPVTVRLGSFIVFTYR